MEREFHIAYVCDKNYILQCAVSLLSLVKNSSKDVFWVVHFLHDGSLEKNDFALLKKINDAYKNFEWNSYVVKDTPLDQLDYSGAALNKMTMYRLLLPEILSNVDSCLYLDSDTLIMGDIASIFETQDLADDYLAAVKDQYMIEETDYTPDGLSERRTYFNAGVLLMNLSRLRMYHMQDEFLRFAGKNYLQMDQDVLNVSCQGKVRFLPTKYNAFSFLNVEHPVVLHFAGGNIVRPWKYQLSWYSDEWWKMAEYFKGFIHYEKCKEDARMFTEKLRQMHFVDMTRSVKKVYIFGAGDYGKQLLRAFDANKINVRAVLDNGAFSGKIYGVPVMHPEEADFAKRRNAKEDYLVIISNQNEENQSMIQKQLTTLGVDASRIRIYHPMQPEILQMVDERYLEQVKRDIIEFQYGRRL